MDAFGALSNSPPKLEKMMRESTEDYYTGRIYFILIFGSTLLPNAQGQRSKWKTKLPQGNTGRVYIYEWDKEIGFDVLSDRG